MAARNRSGAARVGHRCETTRYLNTIPVAKTQIQRIRGNDSWCVAAFSIRSPIILDRSRFQDRTVIGTRQAISKFAKGGTPAGNGRKRQETAGNGRKRQETAGNGRKRQRCTGFHFYMNYIFFFEMAPGFAFFLPRSVGPICQLLLIMFCLLEDIPKGWVVCFFFGPDYHGEMGASSVNKATMLVLNL